jgi:hypothetical protein
MVKTETIIIIVVIIIALFFLYRKQENFTTSESNEAIQNIASVYSDTSGTVFFNNVTATGNIKPNTIGNSNWNIDQSGNVTISGTLYINSDITTKGNISAQGNITSSNTMGAPTGNFTEIHTNQINGSNWYINGTDLNLQGINILQQLKNTTMQLKNLMTFLSPQYNVSTLTWAG